MKKILAIGCILAALLATAVMADDDDDKGKEIKRTGVITSVSGDDFTVGGTTFTVNDDTDFEHGTRDDLAPGRMVKVEGYEDNGSTIAKNVEFKDSDDDDGDDDDGDDDDGDDDRGGGHDGEIEIKGIVTDVGAGVFTVGGTQFNITGKTHFIRMTADDLVAGIMVEVKGEEDGSGGYDAVRVKLEDHGNGDDRGSTAETGVLASVNELGDELLELILEDGTMMVVDEDTRLSGRHGLKSKAKDLIPGLTLRLQYKKSMSLSEGERREATHLNVIGNEAVKGFVSGVVAASIQGSIMVGNAEVHYDKRTIVQGDTDANDPDEIPNGQYVVALSNPLADGSYLANRIIATDEDDDDEDDLGKKVKFYGLVSAVSSEGFSVGEQNFIVNDDTEWKVKGCDEPFDASLLEEGMSVKVIAAQDPSGDYIAVEVTVQLPIFKFTGPIDAISATALSMLGVDMVITENTEYEGVTPGELGVGSIVEVKAVAWPDDTLIVCDIELAEDDEDEEEFEVGGMISEKTVDGDNVLITVGGLVIVIEPGTDIRSRNMLLDTEDLAVGVEVQVSGYIEGGDYIAKHVKVR